MKRNRRYNLFGWLAASMLLMTAACADNADLYAGMPQDNANGDTNTVTFTIQPQSQAATSRRAASRRDGEEDNTTGENSRDYFGDGTKTDVLIFAIYEKEGDGWKLLENFGGKDGAGLDEKLGSGQNSLSVTTYPVTIQLTLGAGKKYRAAFWAQDKECGAYDTRDLTAVQVSYQNTDGTDAANNDESRDAFCAYKEFEGSDKQVTATLKRPFAQVNVGTAGWDYEGAAILKPNAVTYTQSTITLRGVAQYYNVLEGKAIVDNDGHQTTNATFSYSKIPAFVKVTHEQWNDENHQNYLPFGGEEYLKVNLNYDKSYDYVGWDDFKDNTSDDLPKTEKYKYLSMCYILVPEATSSPLVGNNPVDEDGNHTGATTDKVKTGAVLTSVEFNTKGIYVEDETAADGTVTNKKGDEYVFKDAKDKGVFTIYNVPVQKNWRTNILGNSFYTTNQTFIVDIVPDYCGDYNNVNEDDEWQNLTLEGSEEDGWHYTGDGNPNEGFGDDEHNHKSDYEK